MMVTLKEGGNEFRAADGTALTRRVAQADVAPTVKWLEQTFQIDLPHERWLGSTGKAADSGDIDLAILSTDISKQDLANRLATWLRDHGVPESDIFSQGQKKRDGWIKVADELHFRAPIRGNPQLGFVQTDFNFFNEPISMQWGQFYRTGTSAGYKGMYRNVLLSSLAKVKGLKVGGNGVIDRATNEVRTTDPDELARLLLGNWATVEDLRTVESIYAALAKDPQRDAKLADFREYLKKAGLEEPTLKEETEVNFLARLRDRIVNRGYVALVEAEQAGVGGRAKGIEHLEDLVFRRGTDGIRQALDIVAHATQKPSTVTAKWDGKPAVIWGRKPSTGEFVLTDGSGFEARGYDGLFTSPQAIAQNMKQRDATAKSRGAAATRSQTLTPLYRQLWPVLEASLPENFRGYVKGDVLYTQRPPEQAGNFVFTPNTIEYRIPVRSKLGQRIAASDIGIAVHSMYADQGEPRQPLSRVTFNAVPGLMLERPATPSAIAIESQRVKNLKSLLRKDGAKIDTLFNPAELRAHQITDLASLCVSFINSKVGTVLDPASLVPEFGEWLQKTVTPRKFKNIVEYLNSPTSNAEALAAAFTAFIMLHDIKMEILGQADIEHPGQEGWVMATPAGYAKAVKRFDPQAFAALNRAKNKPKTQDSTSLDK